MKSRLQKYVPARRASLLETLETRRLLTDIVGSLFSDNNYSGTHDAGELSNSNGTATVYVDANNNGALDAGETQTLASGGVYALQNLAPGTYTLRAVASSGSTVTSPATNGALTVTVPSQLPSGQTFVAGGDFGIAPTPAAGSISGFMFSDADASGTVTTGDSFGSFGSVFLDLNNDAVHEASEPLATIANNYGQFTFINLQPGNYTVRASGSSYALTTPATQAYTVTLGTAPYGTAYSSPPSAVAGLAFGFAKQSTSATVRFFTDTNSDGKFQTGEPALYTGVGAYIDLNNDGQRQATEPVVQDGGGYANLAGLPNGTFTVRPLGGTDYTPTTAGISITLPGPAIPVVQFGFVSKAAAVVSGNVFRDDNNNGTRDAAETGINGTTNSVRIYLDANNDGVWESTETSTFADASGNYSLTGTPGAAVVRMVLPSAQFIQSSPTGNAGRSVTLAAGTTVAGQNFGLVPFGTISGIVGNDANSDGTLDNGETPLANVLIYLDANGNGQFDYGETSVSSASNGYYVFGNLLPGTYSVRQIVPASFRQVIPFTPAYTLTIAGGPNVAYFYDTNSGAASISGTAYSDANANGVKDNVEGGLAGITVWDDTDNDGKIDSNEQEATTDASGNYTLRGLPAGTYNLKAEFFNTQTPTSPGAAGNTVTVTTGQAKSGVNFGAVSTTPAYISGYVFSDTNKNGIKDAGEVGIAGVYVYIDINKNGILDGSESVSKTDSTGFWSTQTTGDLGAVRYAFYNQTGLALTTPGYVDVTPHAGQRTLNVNYGVAPAAVPTNPASITLEAENATLTGGTVKATNHANYTGTGFADFGGNGSAAQFNTTLNAASAATLTFRYANGSTAARPLSIVINGVTIGSIACAPTGSWDTWSTVSINTNLIAGTNTIKAVAGTATGGNVDGLTITTGSSTPVTPAPVAIDAGGPASGSFAADNSYTGGSTYSSTAVIDTSAIPNAAPQAVYQTERFGNFTYTIANLTAGKQYSVQLDFDELYFSAVGKRIFIVTGNGAAWLINFDIYAAAGGKNKAIAKTFTSTADSSGKIAIVFKGITDNAKVNAIRVTQVG